jgi:DNA-binding NtrC family response regulator
MDTLTLQPERERDGTVTVAALFVVIDAGRPRASTRHLLRGVGRVVIGRGREYAARRERDELVLELPDPHLSLQHAAVVREVGGWVLRDLGSKNGVKLGGERVAERQIESGDWIELGETFLRFRMLKVPAAAADDLVGAERGSVVPVVEHSLGRLVEVAPSAVSVLLLGESGAGKEVAARLVHERSGRPGQFVAVNCAGIVDTLAAATLFGHRRGAYTGAIDDRPGAIRASHHGTLLLDEVADLPAATQGVLLRVLQEREVVPVGDTVPVPVDVRFIAATLRDLARDVDAGRFRVDLYARLAGLRITLPPLRERIEDLGTLITSFLARHAPGRELGLSPAAASTLCRHRWPLNVRELDQAIAAAVAVARTDRIGVEDLPDHIRELARAAMPASTRREELLALLRDYRGNLAAVARALNTSRAQVHRLLRRFKLDPHEYRQQT